MSTTNGEPVLVVPVTEDRDHIRGPADAAVTLVEYGDYECPYSGAAYPIIKEVQARLGETFRFVFRNFPLTSLHRHAQQAAEAAEGAAGQDRFWQMHDLLFENQRHLRDHDLHDYAAKLGLDVELFDQELAEHVHAARIEDDSTNGARSGVSGTPTFYINGVRHDDSYEFDSLLAALERAAASSRDR
jgi:protein-disulfide isomerase